jgi:hypothetical protein
MVQRSSGARSSTSPSASPSRVPRQLVEQHQHVASQELIGLATDECIERLCC